MVAGKIVNSLIFIYVIVRLFLTNIKTWLKTGLTFNEINNKTIFLDMFGSKASDADYQEGYQILHHQFVVSAKAVQIGHAINPDFMIGNMICGITFYLGICDPADILLMNTNGNQAFTTVVMSKQKEKIWDLCQTSLERAQC